ncbi:hypothetical protein CASFOL_014491 [Castilleja foliolosa]|uniref:Uncharacterized protein n=1 Tax=Castilleja foliolosa TaxID=1961234 RepID=A0ABD3DS42_9LAMI
MGGSWWLNRCEAETACGEARRRLERDHRETVDSAVSGWVARRCVREAYPGG